ncbi:MAG TPA: energy transducer TonB [Castellaniella sp.]|nr:energy transducer TonB [Castellaniella sp.]
MRSRISRCPWQKATAALAALGLHAAVLAMVLSSPVAQVAQGQPEALDVQFVELTPAPGPAESAAATEQVPEPERPPALPVNEAPAPEPQPALVSEATEPELQPAAEPQPDDESEPESREQSVPKLQPEPLPKPESRPKPKSKPRPKPVPVRNPRPAQPVRSAPDHEANPLPTASSSPSADSRAQPSPASEGQRRPVDADRPRTVGQVDYLGKRPTPVYPRLSERRGEQGRVMLRVLISPQGRVADVTVQRSSGYARLDEAAVQAMRQARFRPYTENGVAYPARVDIPFDFVL